MKEIPVSLKDFKDDSELTETEEVSIDSLFSNINVFKILLNIAGKEYIVSVEELLTFKKDLNSLSDDELDTYIDKTSAWLFTLATANVDTKRLKRIKNLDFDKWKAKKYKNYKESHYKERTSDKNFIFELINSVDGDLYSIKVEAIDKLELMIEKMDKLYDILMRRVEILRTIIRNRRELKGGRGRSFSV